jgi:hypothetical protein
MPPQSTKAPDFIPAEPDFIPANPSLTTEESEHARQLKPALPLSSTITPERTSSALDRSLAPSDMTGNDPNTLRGYGKTWGEFLKGAGAGIKSLITTPPPGTKENPIIWNPITQVKKDWSGLEDLVATAKDNPNYAAGVVTGPSLLTHTLSKLFTPAGMAAKLTRGTGVSDATMIEETADDLRAAAKSTGTPKTIGQFIDSVSSAETTLINKFASALGQYAPYKINLPDVDGNFPLSKAILDLKEKYPRGTEIGDATRRMIDTRAAEFQRPISLADLNRERINADARRFGLYQQSDVRKYASSTANAENAVDTTISDWVRNNAYPEMDKLTGKPEGYFRNLQQRVGNLMRIHSETKENAVKLHTQAMKERGSTRWERARPGASVSQSGTVHTYLPNIPAWLRPENPEEGANAAIRSGYSPRQNFQPPPEVLSLPVSALLGTEAFRHQYPPSHPLSQSPIQ